ncbi:hypothetical protein AOB58_1660 [Staphylococcus sp. AntiMn-1]|nr:hypothetical protein AOB58_1660 [Staphylococcus sp. AntiMn-1]
MSKFQQKENDILINYYKTITITDVLNDVMKEDIHETI